MRPAAYVHTAPLATSFRLLRAVAVLPVLFARPRPNQLHQQQAD